MTLSPVVTQTTEAAQLSSRPLSSPFKTLASGQTSSSGTPKLSGAAGAAPTSAPLAASAVAKAASVPPTLDLAEQMNLEEKRKYVKGTFTCGVVLGGTCVFLFLFHSLYSRFAFVKKRSHGSFICYRQTAR